MGKKEDETISKLEADYKIVVAELETARGEVTRLTAEDVRLRAVLSEQEVNSTGLTAELRNEIERLKQAYPPMALTSPPDVSEVKHPEVKHRKGQTDTAEASRARRRARSTVG